MMTSPSIKLMRDPGVFRRYTLLPRAHNNHSPDPQEFLTLKSNPIDVSNSQTTEVDLF